MITIKFFASVRESIGQDEVTLEAKSAPYSVAALITDLIKLKPEWESTLNMPKILIAVNHEVCSIAATVSPGDEVAFFPPMTGG